MAEIVSKVEVKEYVKCEECARLIPIAQTTKHTKYCTKECAKQAYRRQ